MSGGHQGHAQRHAALSAALPGRLPADPLVQVLLLCCGLRGGPRQKEGTDRWGTEQRAGSLVAVAR